MSERDQIPGAGMSDLEYEIVGLLGAILCIAAPILGLLYIIWP